MDHQEDPSNPAPAATVDVAVIGAGPIGIEVAAELRRRGLSTLNIDRGALGAQIVAFPPRTRWFSGPERIGIAGVPLETIDQEKATREDYLAYLRAVVRQFDLPLRTFETVETIVRTGDRFLIETTSLGGVARRVEATSVVLAVGGTARHRRLGCPGEDLPHVRRDLGDAHWGFGRRVLIVGGKNSAADAAIKLWRAGARVTISYRGEGIYPRIKYWIRPELESCIRSGLIDAKFGTVPTLIEPDAVELRHEVAGRVERLEVDDVLLQIGFDADGSLFESLGCEVEGEARAVVHDPGTMETSIPGVFVAGTAVAGTQGSFKVYIENSHIHAQRIAAHLAGESIPADPVLPELPEA